MHTGGNPYAIAISNDGDRNDNDERVYVTQLFGEVIDPTRPDGFDGWWNGLITAGYPSWVILYVLSGEFLGALLLIPGIFTRWVALYALPLIVGAAQFWLVRKGFFFTGAGAELPVLWAVALLVQAGLGDGAYALVPSPPFP